MIAAIQTPLVWGLVITGAVFVRGYLTLSRLTASHGHRRNRLRRRMAMTVVAAGSLLAVLLGPVDAVADHSFTVHMAQHLVLLMVVPPLLVLGAPWTPLMRGLPPRARLWVAHGEGMAGVRRAFSWLNRPWPAWIALNVNLWVWHIPAVYGATLTSPPVHYAEHLLFVSTGVLWWLQVVDSAPLRAKFDAVHMIGPQVACMVSGWILAMWLSYAATPIYLGYASQAHLAFGMSAINDQRVAASLMWVFGGIPYGLAITFRAYYWLARPERDWRMSGASPRRRWTAIGSSPST